MSIPQRIIELERQLALAQGHEVAFVASSGTVWIRKPDGELDWLPSPARDLGDCMSLMLRVGVWPRERRVAIGDGMVFEVVNVENRTCHLEYIVHDDDRKAHFMLAVVAGAIAVLNQAASKKTSA